MTATDAADEEQLELRPASEEDLPGVHDVFVAASALPGQPVETRTPEQVRAWVLAVPESAELWVAVRRDQVLGFAALREDWLTLLFVHPDLPAAGVGSALIGLVQALRPHGFGLRVLQANDRARSFYARHGMVELESTDGSTYLDASPDVRMAWLGDDPLRFLRERIDEVDDELAILLARRTALTAAVQDAKAAAGTDAGEQGRDPGREAAIVDRMAEHVPTLAREQLTRVMHAVIEESLAAWERRRA